MTIVEDAKKVGAFANTITHGHAIILVVLAALAAAGGSYALWHHKVYKEGYDACQREDEKATIAYDAQIKAADARTAAAVSAGQMAVLQAQAARPAGVASAKAAAQAVPAFAQMQRPPELAAQRQRELEAISRAVGGPP